MILAGAVLVDEVPAQKPSDKVRPDQAVRLREDPLRYVSRGGLKLEGALDRFLIDPTGLICADLGASTGGFTDCLLQRGAAKVYAVDVGWGQLHARLRVDPRVVVLERTNARDLGAASFPDPVDLVVVDASFIGIGKLMPAIAAILRPGGELVALVKPQFEAGREEVSRGRGVIRDPAVREAAIRRALADIESVGFTCVASVDSTLAGPRGNLEHLVFARRSA